MKSVNRIVFVLIALFALAAAGCGDVAELMDGEVEKTLTVERLLHDGSSERDVRHSLVVEAIRVSGGQTAAAPVAAIDNLAEEIDVAIAGEGEVQFFVQGHLRNRGEEPIRVVVAAQAHPAVDQQPLTIGSITLAAGETRELVGPNEMDQSAEEVNANFQELFLSLEAGYEITPFVTVEGDSQDDLMVDWIFFATTPVYRHTEQLFEDSEIRKYRKNIRSLDSVKLKGQVANLGEGRAVVRLYVSNTIDPDPEEDLVAEAVLEPGQTLDGASLLVAGGLNRIAARLDDLLSGGEAFYTLVAVSESPLTISSDSLELALKVTAFKEVF